MPTIKPDQFAETFYGNLPDYQRKANNEWSEMMYHLINEGGVLTSPDNSFPTLTKTSDGWRYKGEMK